MLGLAERVPSARVAALALCGWLAVAGQLDLDGGGSSAVAATPKPKPKAKTMGPLRVLAANPRYFTKDGKAAIYLTGSHTWTNLIDRGPTSPPPRFDYAGYLAKLQAWGHNYMRLWAWENFRDDDTGDYGTYDNAPQPFLRTGPGTALDGLPKFNLEQLDPAYFQRLRQRVLQARARGIYVGIMLFEGYGVQLSPQPWAWQGHPMNPRNNVNGIDGDLDGDGRGTEVHTLRDRRIVRLEEAYVRRVVGSVADLDNVLFEIGNEIGPYSTAFQYHFINFIKRYERAKKTLQHPVGMTFQYLGGSNETLYRSPADWISTRDSVTDPPIHPLGKVVLSDSDHHCGANCVDADWVWRSFLRGQNPIFMDSWGRWGRDIAFDDPAHVRTRNAVGQTRSYARRMSLAAATPRVDVCSTGFCLVVPRRELLVLQPARGQPFTVSLEPTQGSPYAVEWLKVSTGQRSSGGTVSPGAQTLTPPFDDAPAVAYLRSTASSR